MNDINKKRLYLDLIHDQKLNAKQREQIKIAVEEGLETTRIKTIANREFTFEQMEQLRILMKKPIFTKYKNIFETIYNTYTPVEIIRLVNLCIDDELDQNSILNIINRTKYNLAQMEELRLIYKERENPLFALNVIDTIISPTLSASKMRSCREAILLGIHVHDLMEFKDLKDNEFQFAVDKLCDGLIPLEVKYCLSDDLTHSELLSQALMNGVSDNAMSVIKEIKNTKLLTLCVDVLSECHDEIYIDTICKLPNEIIVTLINNENSVDWLLEIHRNRNELILSQEMLTNMFSNVKAKDILLENDKNNLITSIKKELNDDIFKSKVNAFFLLNDTIAKDTQYVYENNQDVNLTLSCSAAICRYYQEQMNTKEDVYFILNNDLQKSLKKMEYLGENDEGYLQYKKGTIYVYLKNKDTITYELDSIAVHGKNNETLILDQPSISEYFKEKRQISKFDKIEKSPKFKMKEDRTL